MRSSSRSIETARLCGRVNRLLLEIFCACDDPLLQELEVLDVVAAPSASRLAVTVGYVPRPPELLSPDAMLARLNRARGWVRSELASLLDRRRVPELRFVAVPQHED